MVSNSMNTYILCLEIEPVELGAKYDHLPPHCTLMLWFQSDMPTYALLSGINDCVSSKPAVNLRLGEEAIFGPPDVKVNKVELTPELKSLHMAAYDYLLSNNVEFQKPQFVGSGYHPHVSHRDGFEPRVGESYFCDSIYLAQTDESHKGPRAIIGKFQLKH